MLKFLDSCYNVKKNNSYMATIFLNLSNAFDTIDHRILLDKFEHMGIRNNVFSIVPQ